MLYANSTPKEKDYEKIRASPEVIGYCPDCKELLIPKCGEKIIWHWAHKAGVSHETKEETEWHLWWKSQVPKEWCEEKVGCHRADIRFPTKFVVEFQHSNIAEKEVKERLEEYKIMMWVLDGREGEIYSKARDTTFARFGRYYVDCGNKMYLFDTNSNFYVEIDKDIFIAELKAGRIYDYNAEIIQAYQLKPLYDQIKDLNSQVYSLESRIYLSRREMIKTENELNKYKQEIQLNMKTEGDKQRELLKRKMELEEQQLKKTMLSNLDRERLKIFNEEYHQLKDKAKERVDQEIIQYLQDKMKEIKTEQSIQDLYHQVIRDMGRWMNDNDFNDYCQIIEKMFESGQLQFITSKNKYPGIAGARE